MKHLYSQIRVSCTCVIQSLSKNSAEESSKDFPKDKLLSRIKNSLAQINI